MKCFASTLSLLILAATGASTIALPQDFPTAEKASQTPEKK